MRMVRREGYVVFNEAGNYLGSNLWWMTMGPDLPYVHDRRKLIRQENLFSRQEASRRPQFAYSAVYDDSEEQYSVTFLGNSIQLNGSFNSLRKSGKRNYKS